jgi:peptidoglycan LD-endopeptidase LytH
MPSTVLKARGRILLVSLLLTGSAAVLSPRPGTVRLEEPKIAANTPAATTTVVRKDAGAAALPGLDASKLDFMPGLVIPVQGVLATQLRDSFNAKRGARRHEAIDILAPEGTPVLSATAGRVLHLSDNDIGGLMVFATDASEKYIFLYAHLDDYVDDLEAGMPLKRGQVIGYVGTTGNAPSDAPHLHFAIKRAEQGLRWSRGTPIDPRPLLMLPTDNSVAGRASR